MALILSHVYKKIKDKTILEDIDLQLEEQFVYGLVGRNGSGKTMLFRAIAGLMKIDAGEITFNDMILHRDVDVFPNLGITLENASLYPEFTGMKNLQLLARIHNRISDQDIKDAIQRVGLDPADRRTLRKYSLGMKQRIVLAQAIMEKPAILLLDEPTNSLDAEGVILIRKLIREEKDRGALVIIASHSREDIELLADKVIYIDAGKLLEQEERL